MPMPRVLLACLTVAAAGAFACAANAENRFKLPDGPGVELVYGNCQTCHDLQYPIDSAGLRPAVWDALLDDMRGYGLRISDSQRQRILDYLSTYLGPNPPPVAAEPAQAGAVASDGEVVFEDTCAACHQEGGVGKDNEFPPLASNPDLFISREFPAYVVLNGIEGKITVAGTEFDNIMPPFDFLSDEEIAAVLAFARASWGNPDLRPEGMADLAPQDIADIRAKPLDSAGVADMRASLGN